jgi:hypothetical protein
MSDTPKPSHAKKDRAVHPKVPPFARYKGTSAWRKDRRRVRAYAWFLKNQQAQQPSASGQG